MKERERKRKRVSRTKRLSLDAERRVCTSCLSISRLHYMSPQDSVKDGDSVPRASDGLHGMSFSCLVECGLCLASLIVWRPHARCCDAGGEASARNEHEKGCVCV